MTTPKGPAAKKPAPTPARKRPAPAPRVATPERQAAARALIESGDVRAWIEDAWRCWSEDVGHPFKGVDPMALAAIRFLTGAVQALEWIAGRTYRPGPAAARPSPFALETGPHEEEATEGPQARRQGAARTNRGRKAGPPARRVAQPVRRRDQPL